MANSYKKLKLRKIESAKVKISNYTLYTVFHFTEIVPDIALFKNTLCIFHRVIFTTGPSVPRSRQKQEF
jgi:hypothetical protein